MGYGSLDSKPLSEPAYLRHQQEAPSAARGQDGLETRWPAVAADDGLAPPPRTVQPQGGDELDPPAADQPLAAPALSAGAAAALAAQDDPMLDAWASLLAPWAGARGIFEVTLPNGARLGVAVESGMGGVSYLLTPYSERLAADLRQRKMELRAALARRIQRNVKIAVL